MKSKKPLVLHVIQSLDNGGCENFLLRCLPLMTKVNNRILTLKCKGDLAGKFEKAGIKVGCLKGKWINLVSYAKETNPDLVVTYLFHADLLGRIYLGLLTKYKPIPYLRTTYNYSKYRWVRLFEKFTSSMVPKYLANSNSVKDFYVKRLGVEANKITVIPNGIDLKDYIISKTTREKLRQSASVNKDEVVITCVANFHPSKGHEYLLRAFAEVFKKRKNTWLWLVGDGEERKNILKLSKELLINKRTIFWGKRNDVPIILGLSDIFVLPTLFEGMSNAILEAMASGLPVVASRITENSEIISSEKDGLLVRTENVSEMVEALEKLIKESKLGKEISNRAKEKISEMYNISNIAENLDGFLVEVYRNEKR
jgi:glycosyltransferase involved in cell wall biosynthesis